MEKNISIVVPGASELDALNIFDIALKPGTTVGETLLRFYGFDMIAHRWDIAAAAGLDHRFTEDELTEMESAADGFGDALYADGICERLDTPAGADRQTALLARLGRRA